MSKKKSGVLVDASRTRNMIKKGELTKLYTEDGEVVYCPPKMLKVDKDGDGRERLCVASLNPDHLPHTITPYNTTLASEICERIACGETMTSILKDEHMPKRNQIWRWLKKHPEFQDAYNEAKEARADFHRDQVLESAEERDTSDMTAVNREKFRASVHKWLAEKDDPTNYNYNENKARNAGAPTQIIINTGVPSKEDEHPTIQVEGKTVE